MSSFVFRGLGLVRHAHRFAAVPLVENISAFRRRKHVRLTPGRGLAAEPDAAPYRLGLGTFVLLKLIVSL